MDMVEKAGEIIPQVVSVALNKRPEATPEKLGVAILDEAGLLALLGK